MLRTRMLMKFRTFKTISCLIECESPRSNFLYWVLSFFEEKLHYLRFPFLFRLFYDDRLHSIHCFCKQFINLFLKFSVRFADHFYIRFGHRMFGNKDRTTVLIWKNGCLIRINLL